MLVKMLHFCHRLFIYGFYLWFTALSETFVALVKAQQVSRSWSFPSYLHTELQSSASLCLVSAAAGWDEHQGVFPIKFHRERALRFCRCFQPSQQQMLQLVSGSSHCLQKGSWGHVTPPSSHPTAPPLPLGDLNYPQCSVQKQQPLLLLVLFQSSLFTQNEHQAFFSCTLWQVSKIIWTRCFQQKQGGDPRLSGLFAGSWRWMYCWTLWVAFSSSA